MLSGVTPLSAATSDQAISTVSSSRSVGVVLATSTFKAGVQEAVRRAATHIIGFFIKLELKFFRCL
jgi:hypothetical protein